MAKKKTTSRSGAGGGGGGALGEGPGPRIAVFHGPELLLQSERTRALRESIEEALGEGSVEVIRYDGVDAAIADVLDECRSFDLMQRHKLVVVDNADKLLSGGGSGAEEDDDDGGVGEKPSGRQRQLMERYAASPSPNATLVLRGTRWNKGNLDKHILKVGVIEKCETQTPAKAAAWAVKRTEKRHGATLTREGAAALVDRVGSDLGRIDAELGKLASAVGEGASITPEVVREFVGLSREEEVWAIQRVLASGDAEASLRVVREALRVSRHAAQLVWWAQADLARKLHAMARLIEEGTPDGVAARKARFWKQDEFPQLAWYARRAGSARLAALLDRAIELDRRAKTGYSDAEHACEALAIGFASAAGASGR